jgi:RHS repeat-associated protein
MFGDRVCHPAWERRCRSWTRIVSLTRMDPAGAALRGSAWPACVPGRVQESPAARARPHAYDGDTLWAQLDGSNNLEDRYLYQPNDSQILVRIVASGGNAGPWAYLTDAQGSARDLVNWSGQVEDHIDYTGYGVLTETNPSVGSIIGYNGYLYEQATGCYYVDGSWYNPGTGTWEVANQPSRTDAQVNLSEYMGNDPTNLMDGTQPNSFVAFQGENRIVKQDEGNLPLGKTVLESPPSKYNIPFGDDIATIIINEQTWRKDELYRTERLYQSFTLQLGDKPTPNQLLELSKAQWFQTFKADRYDAAGNISNSGTFGLDKFESGDATKASEYQTSWGKWALDAQVLNTPYYTDNKKSTYRRGKDGRTLTMWDGPNFNNLLSPKYPTIVLEFDTYLVVDKKAVYRISWKATFKLGQTRPRD